MADRLLAKRFQEEEREQFTVEERAKFLHDTIDAQRRFLAQQRSEAIRNKPPTKNQLRNQMMTYLKHVGNFQHSHLKTKKFEEIQTLYEKIKRSDEDFIAIRSDEDERMIKEMNEKGNDSSKNESVKEEGKEECVLDKVSSPDGVYLVIHKANGNFRAFNYLMEIMMESLKKMIKVISGVNQQDWKIITWRLYEACGVCILELEDGIVIHMLVERRYPLSKELLQRMLDLGLEVERESVDWTSHSEDEQENYAFMAYNSSSLDTEREQLGDANIEIHTYTQALKKVEAQLVAHQQGQLWYEEKIRFMKINLDDKTDVLHTNKITIGQEAEKEKEDLKLVLLRDKGKLLLSPQQVVIETTKDITGTRLQFTMVDQFLDIVIVSRSIGRLNPKQAWDWITRPILNDIKTLMVGPVAFGGSKGYITSKGKIIKGKLDFEDVCFVKELQHFNLFSVSQMCDKKNKVLFTDSECLVLSLEFKLPDEDQVLLRIPRQIQYVQFHLEIIIPSGGLLV
ncbi:hypothetical protein Tco_0972022 [Tanacetum coccineum]